MTKLDSSAPHPSAPTASSALREGLVLLLAVVLLAIPYYHGSPSIIPVDLRFFFWIGLNVICLLLVPLAIIRWLWRESAADYGLSFGDVRAWSRYAAVYLAVMVPVLIVASRLPSLHAFYPRYAPARHSAAAFIAAAGAWVVYFLAWEFFFRGFLLFVFLRRHGPLLAIAVQTVPFVMMHFPKPEAEALSSIIAGVALGWMAYRGQSIVGCWLVHWTCAILLDLLVVLWPIG